MLKCNVAVVTTIIMSSSCAAATSLKERPSVVRPTPDFEMTVPSSWEVEVGEHMTFMNNPESMTMMVLISSRHRHVKELLLALEDQLNGLIKDVRLVSDPVHTVVNNLKHIKVTGTGRISRRKVDMHLTLISGDRHTLVLLAIGKNLNSGPIQDVYNSIHETFKGPTEESL